MNKPNPTHTERHSSEMATAEDVAALAAKHATGHRFGLDDLRTLMQVLRSPEIGCPWDAKQTYASIASYTIEEAYEVADAIERRDFVDLKYELGDHLFQVVFHAQMAAEEGRFTLDDVVDGVTRKMIRRHPHVFGDAGAREAGDVPGQWARIKADEVAAKREAAGAATPAVPEPESLLDGVPLGLPALTRAVKLQHRAAKVGFDWSAAPPILNKMREEIAEFEVELEAGHLDNMEDECGDILFVVANLARHLNIDPEAALRRTMAKFERRFRYIEDRVHEQGRAFPHVSLEDMEVLWDEAKALEKAAKV